MTDKKRLLDAKEKTAEYRGREDTPADSKTEGKPDGKTNGAPRELDHWTDLVGQRIEEAMRQGYFDNLPGQGKPLNLAKNPFVPEDMQMANKLLENNNLIPGWIGERKVVLGRIEQFRAQLASTTARFVYAFRTTDDVAFRAELRAQWRAQLEVWREEMRLLNRRIETLNMQQPAAHLEVYKLIFDDELTRAGIPVDSQ